MVFDREMPQFAKMEEDGGFRSITTRNQQLSEAYASAAFLEAMLQRYKRNLRTRLGSTNY